MKIKKAILTGGGRATRLRPITSTINKHLIPLANKPMIFYAIEKAVEAGIEEIFINTNEGETQLQQYIGDGSHWNIKIQFFVQPGGPQGIAHVVKCAEEFIGNDPFMFYLSDNIIVSSLKQSFEKFEASGADCQLALAKVPDPERFGSPVFGADGALIDTVEKPTHPTNNFAITGITLFGPKVFYEAFKHIKKSARGEYELPDVVSYLIKNGGKVGWEEITGFWKDTGKPNDLLIANELLLDKLDGQFFKQESPMLLAQLVNKDRIHAGTGLHIGENVTVVGPVIIGENCTLVNCTVGPHVTVGKGTTIRNTSITKSIVFSNATLDGVKPLTESLIGERVTMAARRTDGAQKVIIGDDTLIEL